MLPVVLYLGHDLLEYNNFCLSIKRFSLLIVGNSRLIFPLKKIIKNDYILVRKYFDGFQSDIEEEIYKE